MTGKTADTLRRQESPPKAGGFDSALTRLSPAGPSTVAAGDPTVQEQTVHRLFDGDRECTKEEHAVQWLRDWKSQNPSRRKLPSAQRIRNGVMAKYALSISKPIALTAVSRFRIERSDVQDRKMAASSESSSR